jgi:hypothetical protein
MWRIKSQKPEYLPALHVPQKELHGYGNRKLPTRCFNASSMTISLKLCLEHLAKIKIKIYGTFSFSRRQPTSHNRESALCDPDSPFFPIGERTPITRCSPAMHGVHR